MRHRYFAYDSETGFDTFETAEEARNAAKESIEEWRDKCDPMWDEHVANVCWGEISASARERWGGDRMEVEGEQVDVVDYRLVGVTVSE